MRKSETTIHWLEMKMKLNTQMNRLGQIYIIVFKLLDYTQPESVE